MLRVKIYGYKNFLVSSPLRGEDRERYQCLDWEVTLKYKCVLKLYFVGGFTLSLLIVTMIDFRFVIAYPNIHF